MPNTEHHQHQLNLTKTYQFQLYKLGYLHHLLPHENQATKSVSIRIEIIFTVCLQLHHGQPGHVHGPADAVQQDVRDGSHQVTLVIVS